jgi:hypothetical protein
METNAILSRDETSCLGKISCGGGRRRRTIAAGLSSQGGQLGEECGASKREASDTWEIGVDAHVGRQGDTCTWHESHYPRVFDRTNRVPAPVAPSPLVRLARAMNRGKPPKVALVVCRHKVLRFLNAMVKRQTPWRISSSASRSTQLLSQSPSTLCSVWNGWERNQRRRHDVRSWGEDFSKTGVRQFVTLSLDRSS